MLNNRREIHQIFSYKRDVIDVDKIKQNQNLPIQDAFIDWPIG